MGSMWLSIANHLMLDGRKKEERGREEGEAPECTPPVILLLPTRSLLLRASLLTVAHWVMNHQWINPQMRSKPSESKTLPLAIATPETKLSANSLWKTLHSQIMTNISEENRKLDHEGMTHCSGKDCDKGV